jgi:carbonic anhydrase
MKLRLVLVSFCLLGLLFADDHPKTASPSHDHLWQELAAGNARFVAGKPNARNLTADRTKLAKTQNPHVAVLACSDSRVAPELLFDKTLGDLFVVRDAGNTPDPVAIGSLEYSVHVLGSTMIVVMGHESCGAVKAACSGDKMPTTGLDAVVQPIKASCSLAKGKDIEPATRDHIHRAAEALLAQSPILKKAVDDKKLTIVEAYYSLDTGKVERLK